MTALDPNSMAETIIDQAHTIREARSALKAFQQELAEKEREIGRLTARVTALELQMAEKGDGRTALPMEGESDEPT